MGDKKPESSPPEYHSNPAAAKCPHSCRPLFPLGFRFKPYDAELISDYLANKIRGQLLQSNYIPEVQLYEFTPAELTDKYKEYGIDGSEWYFFTARQRLHPTSGRPSRNAGKNNEGFWRVTGTTKEIKDKHKRIIGSKMTFIYYERRKTSAGERRTDFRMHEYVAAAVPDTNVECATDQGRKAKASRSRKSAKKSGLPTDVLPEHMPASVSNSASRLDGSRKRHLNSSPSPNAHGYSNQEMPFVDPFPWFGNNLKSVSEENELFDMELSEEKQTNTFFNEMPDMDPNDLNFYDVPEQQFLTDEQLSRIICNQITSLIAELLNNNNNNLSSSSDISRGVSSGDTSHGNSLR